MKKTFHIKNARALRSARNKKVPVDTKKLTILKAYTETQENQCHYVMSCKVSKSHEKCLSPDNRVFWPKTLTDNVPNNQFPSDISILQAFSSSRHPSLCPGNPVGKAVELATVMRFCRVVLPALPFVMDWIILLGALSYSKKNEKKRRKEEGKREKEKPPR